MPELNVNTFGKILKRKSHLCQKNKFSRPCKIFMVINSPAIKPFDKIYLDIVGPLSITHSNNKYILTLLDGLTRFFDFYLMADAEANTVMTKSSPNIKFQKFL